MTTLLLTRLSGAALLFATLVLGQSGGDLLTVCGRQAITTCYWTLATPYGIPQLASPGDKDTYLAGLCMRDPHGLPEDRCKKIVDSSCADAEKKEFASMERAYATLRAELTSGENCESVVQLGKCMDLDVMRSCDLKATKHESFEKQVVEQNRAAHNLKACIQKAVKTCDAKKNAAAISHLQKITDAITDIYGPLGNPSTANTAQAATTVVAVSLLSLVARNFF